MKHIAVFASGRGTNFDAIYEAINQHEIDAKISFFFSDQKTSLALANAKKYGINALGLSLKDFKSKDLYEEKIVEALEMAKVDLIVLAGYMKIIGKTLLERFEGKIINLHPSLLPLYRGKDAIMRQHHDQVSPIGITIHYVDQGIDTGKIIFQKQIKIDYPVLLEDMEEIIHHVEHQYYKVVIQEILKEMKS